MVEFGARKSLRGVTGLATLCRLKVLRRFDDIGFGQSGATHVAACAVARRSFEYTVDMTALTPRIGVYTRQREAGFDVIEVFGVRLTKGKHACQKHSEANDCRAQCRVRQKQGF